MSARFSCLVANAQCRWGIPWQTVLLNVENHFFMEQTNIKVCRRSQLNSFNLSTYTHMAVGILSTG